MNDTAAGFAIGAPDNFQPSAGDQIQLILPQIADRRAFCLVLSIYHCGPHIV